jgi:hypothetical protein
MGRAQRAERRQGLDAEGQTQDAFLSANPIASSNALARSPESGG